MNKYVIRKKFTFEMSHILDGSYALCCQNIHGHSYVLEVFLCSETLDNNGMVIDFKQLKEIVTELIVDPFDHAFVMNKSHQLNLVLTQDLGYEIILTNYNPTAENMAKDFYWKLKQSFVEKNINAELYKIRLHETDTGYVEYMET